MNVRDDLTKHAAQRRMRPALTGDRNQCPACGELFNGAAAFDKHRTGDFSARRCLTVHEMQAKEMGRNAAGFWVTERLSDQDVAQRDAASGRTT